MKLNNNYKLITNWGVPFKPSDIPFPTKEELASIKQRLNQFKEQDHINSALNALDELCTYLESDVVPKDEFDRPCKEQVQASVNPTTAYQQAVNKLTPREKLLSDHHFTLTECCNFYRNQVIKFQNSFDNTGTFPFSIEPYNPEVYVIDITSASLDLLITAVESYIDFCEDKLSEFHLYYDLNIKKLEPYKTLLTDLLNLQKK